jgi:hypothetical protein
MGLLTRASYQRNGPKFRLRFQRHPQSNLENMWRDEDNSSDNDNTPRLHSYTSTETVESDSMVAGDDDLEVEEGRSFIRDRPHNDNDIISTETVSCREPAR